MLFRSEAGYFIGVDIQKFAVNIGLINFKGDMVELQVDTPYKFDNTEESLNELIKIIVDFIKGLKVDKEKILNVNINISGRVNPDTGYSHSIFNFDKMPLAKILAQRIGYNVTVDNDTRAMAHGEYLQGCVKNEKNILFINISWGLGLSIIIDGKSYTGRSGFAGEIGHVHTYDNQLICHCGKKGCLETEASEIV